MGFFRRNRKKVVIEKFKENWQNLMSYDLSIDHLFESDVLKIWMEVSNL